MGKKISRAESWDHVYDAFQNINFTAFDYNTIKNSIVEYLRLYHPETFNNFIESDELIALIESFCYVAELLAYRIDVASHENFISTAQRKESILRLAKLVSYHPSRNLPARGLVKITSISTDEPITDSTGIDLRNRTILWNDPLNNNWKEQFMLVLKTIMKQSFGSVLANDRIQVNDILFELYNLKNIPLQNGVITYSIDVSGEKYPMELVPASLQDSGPVERRPERSGAFSILYGNDGLGDSSPFTGFFVYTKQGALKRISETFDGVTPNKTFDVTDTNINETDMWINKVDPVTFMIADDGSSNYGRSGEWVPVDVESNNNIIYNTNKQRNKYEVETLTNDSVRIVFGDGEFSNIPSGLFDIWYRTSANKDLIIPRTSIDNVTATIPYKDDLNINRIITFTFTSVSNIQNASSSEDIEHVRKMAPLVYYTQDRMVNSADYNAFMLQDQSILKLHSVNRTFAGHSKYAYWDDASDTYQNVKMFGTDGTVYYADEVKNVGQIPRNISAITLLSSYVEPLLDNTDTFLYRVKLSTNMPGRRRFTIEEKHNIVFNYLGEDFFSSDGSPPDPDFPVYLHYSNNLDGTSSWTATVSNATDWHVKIDKQYIGSDSLWVVQYKTTRLVFRSNGTNFWVNNFGIPKLNSQTFNTNVDTITLLQANVGANRTATVGTILPSAISLVVEDYEISSDDVQTTGLQDNHALVCIPTDSNGDGLPDDALLTSLIGNTVTVPANQTVNLGYSFISDDVQGTTLDDLNLQARTVIDSLTNSSATDISVHIPDYVYFANINDSLVQQQTNRETLLEYLHGGKYTLTRFLGRQNLNFLWTHNTSKYHLVDPSTSNIIDAFIISRGYYLNVRQWLEDVTNQEPKQPTSFELHNDYGYLIKNKMISDELVLHPGTFKPIFGKHAIPQLQAKFLVVRTGVSTLTDNQIKEQIVTSVKDFFDINEWDFGNRFNFTELAAKIHYDMQYEIESVVLVPQYADNFFGDMFQINCREDEILIPSIAVSDVEIVEKINRSNIKQ